VTYADCDDWKALHRAVCERPDDDLPRLVAADWLEEWGTPETEARATFVRAQVRLAALAAGGQGEPTAECVRGRPLSASSSPPVRCGCDTCRLSGEAGGAFDRWGDAWRAQVLAGPLAAFESRYREQRNLLPDASGPLTREELRGRLAEGSPWLFAADTLAYERGFPYALRVPLAVLVGTDCPTCDNLGCLGGGHNHFGRAGGTYHGVLHDTDPGRPHHHHHRLCTALCPTCRGTGRVGGFAAGLFRAAPFTEVWLAEYAHLPYEDGTISFAVAPLIRGISRHLDEAWPAAEDDDRGELGQDPPPSDQAVASHMEAYYAALARAAAAYGRDEAGLPPLPPL
jgi:uncharacterized protein (TIGR02996 family)